MGLLEWSFSEDLQRATNEISYAPRLAQSSADIECNATNYKLARRRLKILGQGAPEGVTVSARSSKMVKRLRRARAASGAPP